jgi:2-dehydro-3-deoxygluconokinase
VRFPSGRALDLVTFGEAMVLHLATPGLPLSAATDYRRSVAGAESNVAIGLARLGHRVGWFGRLGTDVHGQYVLDTIRGNGVDTSRVVRDAGAPTGMIVRDSHAVRPVEVVYHRAGSAASRLEAGDIDAEYLADARLLLMSGVTAVLSDTAREATEVALAEAKRSDTPVVLDLNIRRKLSSAEHAVQVLRPLVSGAQIVLAGTDEAELFTGSTDVARCAAWFHDAGARIVVIKDGASGAYLSDGSQRMHQPAPDVPVVDPVGAGDAFACGLLSALLRDRPLPVAMAEAAAVAGLVLSVASDIDGLPTPAQLDAAMRAETAVNR